MRLSTIKDRIDWALKRAKIEDNQSQLARRLGVDPSTVNKWSTRPDTVAWENIRKISRLTGVSAPWLKDGQGSPDDYFSDEDAEIVRVIRNLNEDARQRVLEAAKFEHWKATEADPVK